MKLRTSTVLLLTLLAVSGVTTASAGILYDNGGYTGDVDAWDITNFAITNSFAMNTGTVEGVNFVTWTAPGDTVSSVDWLITSDPFGGTTFGSGTAAITTNSVFNNVYGYDVSSLSFLVPFVQLTGGTYWLQLQNAVATGGDTVYWDQSDGPSQASISDLGSLQTVGFDGGLACKGFPTGDASCSYSEAFQVTGNPEPASFVLFGTGLAGLGMILRRRNRK